MPKQKEPIEITSSYEECICQDPARWPTDGAISRFEQVRSGCNVLKKILCPDDTWNAVRDITKRPTWERFAFLPMTYHAFKSGELANLTTPFHRYGLDSRGNVRRDLDPNYIADLAETWLSDPADDLLANLHRKSGIYMGKLMEFILAKFLEDETFSLLGLAALGAPSDIQVCDRSGAELAIEVKYMDMNVREFRYINRELLIDFMKSGVVGPHEAGRRGRGLEPRMQEKDSNFVERPDLYGAANYALFRICEAAEQLQSSEPTGDCVAALVIDRTQADYVLFFMDQPWYWQKPHFMEARPEWHEFVESLDPRPSWLDDPSGHLEHVSAVWLMETAGLFDLRRCLSARRITGGGFVLDSQGGENHENRN